METGDQRNRFRIIQMTKCVDAGSERLRVAFRFDQLHQERVGFCRETVLAVLVRFPQLRQDACGACSFQRIVRSAPLGRSVKHWPCSNPSQRRNCFPGRFVVVASGQCGGEELVDVLLSHESPNADHLRHEVLRTRMVHDDGRRALLRLQKEAGGQMHADGLVGMQQRE